MRDLVTLPEPVAGIWLPGYRAAITVTGFHRERGASGRMLTVADAVWERGPIGPASGVSDYVTRMRLADLLSDRHALPVNADKLYGQLGRQCDVARK